MNIQHRLSKLETGVAINPETCPHLRIALEIIMPDGEVNIHCADCKYYGPKPDRKEKVNGTR